MLSSKRSLSTLSDHTCPHQLVGQWWTWATGPKCSLSPLALARVARGSSGGTRCSCCHRPACPVRRHLSRASWGVPEDTSALLSHGMGCKRTSCWCEWDALQQDARPEPDLPLYHFKPHTLNILGQRVFSSASSPTGTLEAAQRVPEQHHRAWGLCSRTCLMRDGSNGCPGIGAELGASLLL